jgi:type I restriction enzyme S subunit
MSSRIKNQAIGSSVPGFNLDQLRNLRLILPPLDEQKRISHILGTLDDKIELNQQINRTLEGIARTLFKSWLIDFDPVRAKLDGRQPAGKVSETQTGGTPSGSGTFLDAETAALFPDPFEDSPLGKIPKGWKQCSWGDFLTLKRGCDLPKHLREEGDVPIVSSSRISGFHSTQKIKAPGVVTGRYGTVGQVFYIWEI